MYVRNSLNVNKGSNLGEVQHWSGSELFVESHEYFPVSIASYLYKPSRDEAKALVGLAGMSKCSFSFRET